MIIPLTKILEVAPEPNKTEVELENKNTVKSSEPVKQDAVLILESVKSDPKIKAPELKKFEILV